MTQTLFGKKAALLLGGALLLMIVALYNGYPLYMGDTHAYMTIGFTDTEPVDRSPFYGYFIRHSSLMETLWLTVLAQCLILSFLLLQYHRLLTGNTSVRGTALFLICTVSFTYVSWVMSCIQSDAFTPAMLLALLLYVLDEQAGKGMRWAYLALGFVAVTMHNSHFLIACLTGAVLLAYALVRRMAVLARRAAGIIGVGVLYFAMTCSMNAARGYGFIFSRASDLFMVAKFAETGILDKYLQDNCERQHLKICAYKDEITPYPWAFMYGGDCMLAKLGGLDSCKEEFRTIIKGVMTTPVCLKMYAMRAMTFTLRQTTEVEEREILTMQGDNWQRMFVKQRLPAEEKEFLRSKQNHGRLDNSRANTVNMLFFLLSSVGLLMYGQLGDSTVRRIYLFFFLFYVVNACVTACGSTVECRYSFRIFWLLPATNAALLLKSAMAFAQRKRAVAAID